MTVAYARRIAVKKAFGDGGEDGGEDGDGDDDDGERRSTSVHRRTRDDDSAEPKHAINTQCMHMAMATAEFHSTTYVLCDHT